MNIDLAMSWFMFSFAILVLSFAACFFAFAYNIWKDK